MVLRHFDNALFDLFDLFISVSNKIIVFPCYCDSEFHSYEEILKKYRVQEKAHTCVWWHQFLIRKAQLEDICFIYHINSKN